MQESFQTVPIECYDGVRRIRIPDGYLLSGEQVQISQETAGRLIVEAIPLQRKELQRLLASWGPLPDEDTFPVIDELPMEPFGSET